MQIAGQFPPIVTSILPAGWFFKLGHITATVLSLSLSLQLALLGFSRGFFSTVMRDSQG